MTVRGSFDLGSACQGVGGDLNDGTKVAILDLGLKRRGGYNRPATANRLKPLTV
jgi:hypothetical protein